MAKGAVVMLTTTELRIRPKQAPVKKEQPKLSHEAREFIQFVKEKSTPQSFPEELPRVQVSMISSSIATLYEQLRNTIDTTEQHLLRRNAIYRFLRRNVLAYRNRQSLGELLIQELIVSGYVANNTFPEQYVPHLEAVIQKYIRFNEEIIRLFPEENPRRLERWGLGLAAVEIERHLYCPDREEALLQFGFKTLKPRIHWEDAAIAPEDRDLQLYIALHRAIFRSDALLLEYHLLTAYFPEWQTFTSEQAPQMAAIAKQYRSVIDKYIFHPKGLRLTQQVRRMAIPLKTLLDTALLEPATAEARLADIQSFVRDTVKIVESYYTENRRASRRSAIRSIMFILITKTLIGVGLEIPYDLWLLNQIRYLPLVINVTFHPLFMFVLGTFVSFPGKENTHKIISDLRTTILANKQPQPYFVRLKSRRSKGAKIILATLYVLTFAVTFGALIYGLWVADFGLLGSIVFILFLSLVTFVGIRLRTRARKYYMIRQRESFFSALFWFFANPFVEVGRWFSTRFTRYNLFLFFFDLVLEAPLKAITYGIEEWFRFARERNEDIIE